MTAWPKRNADVAPDKRIEFRVGINVKRAPARKRWRDNRSSIQSSAANTARKPSS